MQIIKSLFKLGFFVLPLSSMSQSTYLTQGAKEYQFIDRLEIRQGTNTDLNFSSLKPYNRNYIVQQAEYLDSIRKAGDAPAYLAFSPSDEYNMRSLLMNNSEWVTGNRDDFASKKPFLKSFYTTKPNFYEANTKDFFLAINPVLSIQVGNESDNKNNLFYNSRGISIRGRIANKIGFATTITDNQERGPQFFQDAILGLRAVPGNGFYKIFKKKAGFYDYFDGRGYVTFNATKYINFQLGYDKNFIGNGYRSLFLSDWGNSYLFAKINTRIWKFNYQNLFMELMPQFTRNTDFQLPRKYAAMHHLSMNVTKWLNVGLFEGVMFGRTNHFDFQYLNPIIFYRHVEGTIGSPDNAVAGIDFKANALHRFQFYGQMLLDEFILSRVKNDPTNWANKFAFQLGGKYINAFGVKNLDLQLEMNRVRPFTYTHYDTISNYTHYNQPLAHPLGANFQEFVGIVRYQPFPKWYLYARGVAYFKGLDTMGMNLGGDIFQSYLTRPQESGFHIGDGNKATCFNALLNVSYEFRQNLFLDLSVQHRAFNLESRSQSTSNTYITAGIRLNAFRREYDF